jgi:predicted RNA-binding Zn-ribbon protein involved in translation (DUF1610 family)
VFDIYTIIFLALAVFIFLRLRSVLASRPPPEKEPPGMMMCKSCGREISRKAETCPHCGHAYVSHAYVSSKAQSQWGCVIAILLVILVVLVFPGTCSVPR